MHYLTKPTIDNQIEGLTIAGHSGPARCLRVTETMVDSSDSSTGTVGVVMNFHPRVGCTHEYV